MKVCKTKKCDQSTCDDRHLYCDQCIIKLLDGQKLKTDQYSHYGQTSECTSLHVFYFCSKYCTKHICTQSYCYTVKSSTSEACLDHSCMEPNCNKAKKGRGSYYCYDHTCLSFPCRGKKVNQSNYCITHKCQKAKCQLSKLQHNKYCNKHFVPNLCERCKCPMPKDNWCLKCYCKNTDCQELAESSEYCQKHFAETCVIKTCLEKGTNSGFCRIHLADYYQTLKSVQSDKAPKNFLCLICNDQQIDTVLNCGHTGCRQCLDRWQKQKTQPKCHVCSVEILTMGPIYVD